MASCTTASGMPAVNVSPFSGRNSYSISVRACTCDTCGTENASAASMSYASSGRRTKPCGRFSRLAAACPCAICALSGDRYTRGPFTSGACETDSSALRLTDENRHGAAYLPRAHIRTAALLVRPGRRDSAALRYGGRRGHFPSGDLPSLHRSRALGRRLCAAVPPAHRWPVWRQSVSSAALLSVPGSHQVFTCDLLGPVPGQFALAGARYPGP